VSLEPHGGCGDDLDVEIGEADRGVLLSNRCIDVDAVLRPYDELSKP
jgi:hypothetical protein